MKEDFVEMYISVYMKEDFETNAKKCLYAGGFCRNAHKCLYEGGFYRNAHKEKKEEKKFIQIEMHISVYMKEDYETNAKKCLYEGGFCRNAQMCLYEGVIVPTALCRAET